MESARLAAQGRQLAARAMPSSDGPPDGVPSQAAPGARPQLPEAAAGPLMRKGDGAGSKGARQQVLFDVCDFQGTYYPAKVLHVDRAGAKVHVKYRGFSSANNEMVHVSGMLPLGVASRPKTTRGMPLAHFDASRKAYEDFLAILKCDAPNLYNECFAIYTNCHKLKDAGKNPQVSFGTSATPAATSGLLGDRRARRDFLARLRDAGWDDGFGYGLADLPPGALPPAADAAAFRAGQLVEASLPGRKQAARCRVLRAHYPAAGASGGSLRDGNAATAAAPLPILYDLSAEDGAEASDVPEFLLRGGRAAEGAGPAAEEGERRGRRRAGGGRRVRGGGRRRRVAPAAPHPRLQRLLPLPEEPRRSRSSAKAATPPPAAAGDAPRPPQRSPDAYEAFRPRISRRRGAPARRPQRRRRPLRRRRRRAAAARRARGARSRPSRGGSAPPRGGGRGTRPAAWTWRLWTWRSSWRGGWSAAAARGGRSGRCRPRRPRGTASRRC